ncbi:MAG: hypothetical protein KAJ03_01655 [Gammaproteobacteria bacterium]|nr:hypothetical protein [Gammaproteobacteria bacterium]
MVKMETVPLEIKMNVSAHRQFAQDIINACDKFDAECKGNKKGGKKANAE